jgi:hypothetical protein
MPQAAGDTLNEFLPGNLFHLHDELRPIFQDNLMVRPYRQDISKWDNPVCIHFQIVFRGVQMHIQHTKCMYHRMVVLQLAGMCVWISIGSQERRTSLSQKVDIGQSPTLSSSGDCVIQEM